MSALPSTDAEGSPRRDELDRPFAGAPREQVAAESLGTAHVDRRLRRGARSPRLVRSTAARRPPVRSASSAAWPRRSRKLEPELLGSSLSPELDSAPGAAAPRRAQIRPPLRPRPAPTRHASTGRPAEAQCCAASPAASRGRVSAGGCRTREGQRLSEPPVQPPRARRARALRRPPLQAVRAGTGTPPALLVGYEHPVLDGLFQRLQELLLRRRDHRGRWPSRPAARFRGAVLSPGQMAGDALKKRAVSWRTWKEASRHRGPRRGSRRRTGYPPTLVDRPSRGRGGGASAAAAAGSSISSRSSGPSSRHGGLRARTNSATRRCSGAAARARRCISRRCQDAALRKNGCRSARGRSWSTSRSGAAQPLEDGEQLLEQLDVAGDSLHRHGRRRSSRGRAARARVAPEHRPAPTSRAAGLRSASTTGR